MIIRVEFAVSVDDWSITTGSLLCQLIDIHPWLDRYWLLLAQFYRNKQQWTNEYWCLERASHTEASFNILDIKELKSRNSLDQQAKVKIFERVKAETSIPRQQKVDQDFVDIGSSANTKEKEKKLESMQISHDSCDLIITNFERKWFHP